MPTSFTVRAAAQIEAPPERVYAIIADYRNGHPHILPKQFRNLSVEQGGVGAGTIIRFEFTAYGQTQRYRAIVTEPDPGRVLVEENVEPAPSKTTFMVERSASGRGADVTFITEMKTTRDGVPGAIERFLSKRLLRKVYAEELSLLAARARLALK